MNLSRRSIVVACALGLGLFPAALAWAHDTTTIDDGAVDDAKSTHNHHLQHGGDEGHLDAGSTGNITLVSKLALKNVEPGKIADVGVHKGYAYLAAWGGETCKYNGVHVVDIRNPAAPKEVSFVNSKEGSAAGEGVQALSISTPKFTGDILITNNETCNEKTGFGGLNIYNVTKPANPSLLTEGYGDDQQTSGQGKKAAHEIHSVFAWDAGSKAYAVMVDNDEAADVDIVDITDPRKPSLIAEYDLTAQVSQASPGNLQAVFLHDMVVKQIDGLWVMLLSYWDGGYVKMDVTDPANATVVADSDFAEIDPQLLEQTGASEPPEGNAHQAEFTLDNQYILAADEDFSPFAFNVTTGEGDKFFAGTGTQTALIAGGSSVGGDAVYVGRGCIGDEAVPAGDGTQIAVVSRGFCTFNEKFVNIEAAGGYLAAVVIEREGADACGLLTMNAVAGIPAAFISRGDGYDVFDLPGFDQAACLTGAGELLPGVAVGQVGDSISLNVAFDGWGYVRLFSNDDAGKLTELDTYAIPEAMDIDKADGFGDLSVHEVATSLIDPARAYISYYSGGLRVVDIVDGEIVESGRFIDEGGNNFWGVQTFLHKGEEYVAMSDRDLGLYIFKVAP